jgi:hypothetical protein
MEVRHSDKEFGLFTLKSYQLAAAPAKAEEKKENK